jgi:hypothetical protein
MGTNTEQESDMYRQQVDCSALLYRTVRYYFISKWLKKSKRWKHQEISIASVRMRLLRSSLTFNTTKCNMKSLKWTKSYKSLAA